MSNPFQSLKEEDELISELFCLLKLEPWHNNERSTFDMRGGVCYIISQKASVRLPNGNLGLERTTFTRDNKLHRLSGPAYTNYDGRRWYVDGREYTEAEFNFFVKGMIL